jgi:DNA-binding transcriptional ArsR family regulator
METSKALTALAALAQETRLAVFRLLLEHAPRGLPAGQVAERLRLLPASLSFHLKELSRAGLIGARQQGRFVWYTADLAAMNGIVAYLTETCCSASASCVANCTPSCTPAVAGPKPRGAAATKRRHTPARRAHSP